MPHLDLELEIHGFPVFVNFAKALDSNSIPAQRVLQRGANRQRESLVVRGPANTFG